uniref:Uncharacterized protein n=1 Tax=Setaria digitata TaxID=48799 RepID=A0A915PSH9_9BILA
MCRVRALCCGGTGSLIGQYGRSRTGVVVARKRSGSLDERRGKLKGVARIFLPFLNSGITKFRRLSFLSSHPRNDISGRVMTVITRAKCGRV